MARQLRRERSGVVGRVTIALFLFALLIFGLTAAGHMQAVDVSDELQVAQSLLSTGTVAIAHNDGTSPGVGGQDVSGHGIGESILLLPAALAGRMVPAAKSHLAAGFAASLLNPVVAAACVAILFLFAIDLGLGLATAAAVALVFAFASLEWPYAHDAFDVTPTGLALLLSLFALHRYRRQPAARWLLLAGGAIGFGLLLRIPTVLCLPILLAYLVLSGGRAQIKARLRVAPLWAAPVLVAIAVVGWYNWVRFGSPLVFGLQPVPFTTPVGVGLAGLLVSPGKGLLIFSPVVLLGLWGFPAMVREHRALVYTIGALAIANLLFYARLSFWSGEWAWGPRYLVPLVGLLLLPAGFVLRRWRSLAAVTRSLVVSLILVSAAIQALGVAIDYQIQTELMQEAGTLRFEHWKPQYSQIAVHAVALEKVVSGSAPYPAGRAVHDALSGRPPVTTFDFWWIYAWLSGLSHRLVLLAVGLLASGGVAAAVWLTLLLKGRGTNTRMAAFEAAVPAHA